MKIKTTAREFQKALEVVEGIIPDRTPLPSATHVLICFRQNTLVLSGSDGHNQVQVSLPAEGEEGAILAPAKKLLGFVRTLSAQEIIASYDDTTKVLSLTTGNIELKLPTLEIREFPEVRKAEGPIFKVDQNTFCDNLRRTVFAAVDDRDERVVLQGCYVHFNQNTGVVVATDSRRLALAQFTPTAPPTDPNIKFIIPSKIVKLLQSHLRWPGEITCTAGERRVSLECATDNGHYLLTFAHIEGDYPNYARAIPPSNGENTIRREALLQALKRAHSALDGEPEASVTMNFDGHRLDIQTRSTYFHESLEMDYKGKPSTVMFTPGYIAEALEKSPEPEVRFDLAGPHAALVLKTRNYFFLTMPRRV